MVASLDPAIYYIAIIVVLALATILVLGWRQSGKFLRRHSSQAQAKANTQRSGLADFFRRRPKLDPEDRQALRQTLLAADFGPSIADRLIDSLAKQAPKNASPEQLAAALRDSIAAALLNSSYDPLALPVDAVVVMVGINGSGKTTSIAKLTALWTKAGRKVVLGAADTFRAAAAEQLKTWGDRLGCRVVRQAAGADPGAVAFDTVKAAGKDQAMAIIDTAGRVHVDQGLMNELSKIIKVIQKARADAPHAVWLTLDSSQGQTTLEQARQYAAAVPLNGIIVTKLDGEGRAGFVLSIVDELKLPIVGIGTGESLDAFVRFDAKAFADRIVYGVNSQV